MPVVTIANPKGGVGKSTLATHVAGYYASRGASVMLGDVDRQHSSLTWLKLRPVEARPITSWDATEGPTLRPPRGTTHVVLDTPAGLHGHTLREVIKRSNKLLIPLQASIFDMYATRAFLDELLTSRRTTDLDIGVVGMRVDARTIAADKLHEFVATLGLPVLGYLRHTQNYIQLAAHGLTLFDLAPERVAKDLEQWQGICHWLDA